MDRINSFDITRAVCMIWVVIFWHGNFFDGNSPALNCVTIGVLAMFTFISGYLAGLGKAEDALFYYRKKLFRFFPIHFISCLSFYIMYLLNDSFSFITSPFQAFCSITGLACFIGNMPVTIWYFDMLIFFYIMTPWICKCVSIKKQITISLLLYMLLYCGHVYGGVDKRLLIYFPFYFGALIWSRQKGRHIDLGTRHLLGLCFSVTIAISLLCLSFRIENTITFQVITALFICIVGIDISKIIEKINWIKKICRYVSTASLFAYFFHRQFIGIFILLINKFMGWETGKLTYTILGIMLIFSSYFAQKCYDKAITHIISP